MPDVFSFAVVLRSGHTLIICVIRIIWTRGINIPHVEVLEVTSDVKDPSYTRDDDSSIWDIDDAVQAQCRVGREVGQECK